MRSLVLLFLTVALLTLAAMGTAESLTLEGAVCPHEAVLNCATGAGTAADPYIVTGNFDDDEGAAGASCGGLTAAIAICDVTAHLHFQNVHATGLRALVATGTVHVKVADSTLTGSAQGIVIEANNGTLTLVESVLTGGPNEAPSERNFGSSRGHFISGVDVWVHNTTIDGGGAKVGASLSGGLHGSRLTALGATGTTMIVRGAVNLTDSSFTMEGTGDPIPYSGLIAGTKTTYALNVASEPVRIHDSEFQFSSGGIITGGGRPVLDLEGNRFIGTASGAAALDLSGEKVDGTCAAHIAFNDFHADLWNREDRCVMPLGPNYYDDVAFEGRWQLGDELPGPVEELPTVRVLDNTAGYAGQQPARVQVASTGNVEASPSRQDWSAPQAAQNDSFAWSLPAGDASYWLRACTDVCGRPIEITVRTLPAANPPTAILHADALAVAPGTSVVLDASSSFHPDGLPLQYRFYVGSWSPWSNAPTHQATIHESTVLRVEVVDAVGQVDSARITIATFESQPENQDAPTVPLALLVVTLAVLVGGCRRQ